MPNQTTVENRQGCSKTFVRAGCNGRNLPDWSISAHIAENDLRERSLLFDDSLGNQPESFRMLGSYKPEGLVQALPVLHSGRSRVRGLLQA